MPKYKPESRRKMEQKVKDIDSKAKDRTKHMTNVVKNDAKAIADLSKKIKPGGTIEGAKAIKEAQHQAGGEVKKEYGHQKKALENISKEAHKKENEFRERIKDSKSNYKELTKASSSIKETPAARKALDRSRQAAQKERKEMDEARNVVNRLIRRIRKNIVIASKELRRTEGLDYIIEDHDGSEIVNLHLSARDINKVVELHEKDVAKRGPVEGGVFDEKKSE